ncbi:hypothetical protein AQUCO_105200001v1 [Aquilegia coerulea]|uniref:Uncharacterized protein n=1 Tax=Aquilegia coerulea TaxID=218851 RepID=A0A2G5C1M1_AQUCA|nr:hypothetical protein AQUCO_105200001v1 [Aquilegia coerulea]
MKAALHKRRFYVFNHSLVALLIVGYVLTCICICSQLFLNLLCLIGIKVVFIFLLFYPLTIHVLLLLSVDI